MDKKQERWWEAVLTSEPTINVRKIDASRPMTDLDDEAQAKIEEMMFNERQKKMGLPQTHEKVQLCDKSISRLRRRAKLCGSNLLIFEKL